MGQIRGIVVRGDFTDAEFSALVSLLREMDDGRPQGTFAVTAYAEDASLQAASALMREALPPQTGRDTAIISLRTGEAAGQTGV